MSQAAQLDRGRTLRFRLTVLAVLVAAAAAFAMLSARPAEAYTDFFCPESGTIFYSSGENCGYGAYHHLDQVAFTETSSGSFRHCANFLQSNGNLAAWKCDYTTTVIKYPGGQAGYGYVHNGDPDGFWGWANENF
ncbi:MAG TPA: hypothetical protein VF545_05460 [Thermoleophilaceae bacterium]